MREGTDVRRHDPGGARHHRPRRGEHAPGRHPSHSAHLRPAGDSGERSWEQPGKQPGKLCFADRGLRGRLCNRRGRPGGAQAR